MKSLLTSGAVTLIAAVSLTACGSSGQSILPSLSNLPGSSAPVGSTPSGPAASAAPASSPAATASPSSIASPGATASPAATASPVPSPSTSPTTAPTANVSVTPIFDCISKSGTTYYVVLGYKNGGSASKTIAAGSAQNLITIIGSGKRSYYNGQPSVFATGLHDNAFQVRVTDSESQVKWDLDGSTLGPISVKSKACS